MGFIEKILTNEQVIMAIAGLLAMAITMGGAYFANLLRSKFKDDRKADLISGLVNDSVWATYESLVRDWKKSAKDGELDAEEKKAALNHAMEVLKAQAKENGLNIVAELGPQKMRGLIEAGVQAYKAGQVKAGSAAVKPLSDSKKMTLKVETLKTMPPKTRSLSALVNSGVHSRSVD